jgi:hypothetical protein
MSLTVTSDNELSPLTWVDISWISRLAISLDLLGRPVHGDAEGIYATLLYWFPLSSVATSRPGESCEIRDPVAFCSSSGGCPRRLPHEYPTHSAKIMESMPCGNSKADSGFGSCTKTRKDVLGLAQEWWGYPVHC